MTRNLTTPSIYRTNAAQTDPPDPRSAEAATQGVEECTRRILESPYDPELWTERAGYFLKLNYPELAAGDAYKAGLLFDRAAAHAGEEANTTPTQARLKAYMILGQALYDCHGHLEAAEYWEEVAKKVPGDYARGKAAGLRALLEQKERAAAAAGLGGSVQEQKDRLKDGGVLTVRYPWLPERHRTRTPEALTQVNDELTNIEPQYCCLAKSKLDDRESTMGVFATEDIQPGKCVLIDRTPIGACSNSGGFICGNCFGRVKCPPIQSSCCPNLSAHAAHAAMAEPSSELLVYCSAACYDLAMNTYHKALCGKNFEWLHEPARGLELNASPIRPLLVLRLLASCVQTGQNTSPLDLPIISRLQSLTGCGHMDVFTFNESIVAPIRILEQLGVDVFANSNYDTMVLHSAWTRIANNKAGSPDPNRGYIDGLGALLPMLNHSCDPNVESKREDGSTTTRFYTKKHISKGEELCHSYLDVTGMTLEQRQESLWPWFEGLCLCQKCKMESAAA
ncbi:hypothetical protein M011DRAFT_462671 [Sporormia fimetaria CBS 119925]|uniref:Histone-lysine N-methyltransferase SET5 n=1 Tax=Sporormia fimetaria CBS 119925 TaxID=1340428 RepID=A0A6A6UYG7_9PLEO|nr:hypothetical protein M011DRAFT_462671 [Sporormia fimetaria CBS 119925]